MHASCYFDVERSRLGMERLQRVVNPSRPLERAHQLWGEGMYETITGNFAGAIARHEAALVAAESIGGAAHKLVGLILYSAPLILAGRLAEAVAVGEEGLRFGRECQLHTWDACFVMILAWCRHEQGDQAEAGRLLDKAIEVAEDGTYRYFRWLLQGGRKMLAEALRRGIRSETVARIVRQFRYTSPDPLLESWPWPVKIRTLGTFAVEVDGQPLRFGRKTPKRLLSLLQCLIAMGGREVAEHKLADALWPAADGDDAYRRLTLSLHRLRQLLGDAESIRMTGGKVSLNPERVWVDALSLVQRPPTARRRHVLRGGCYAVSRRFSRRWGRRGMGPSRARAVAGRSMLRPSAGWLRARPLPNLKRICKQLPLKLVSHRAAAMAAASGAADQPAMRGGEDGIRESARRSR